MKRIVLTLLTLSFLTSAFGERNSFASPDFSFGAYYGFGWIKNDLSSSKAAGQYEMRFTVAPNQLWNISLSGGQAGYNSSANAIYDLNGNTQKLRYSNVKSSVKSNFLALNTAFNITPEMLKKSNARIDFFLGVGLSFANASNSFIDHKDSTWVDDGRPQIKGVTYNIHGYSKGRFGYFPVGLRFNWKLSKTLSVSTEAEYQFYNSDMLDGNWFYSPDKGRWFDHTINLRTGLVWKF